MSEVIRFPKNATPNRIILDDAGTQLNVYYTNAGDKGHGHSVVVDGKIVYARTRSQRVV